MNPAAPAQSTSVPSHAVASGATCVCSGPMQAMMKTMSAIPVHGSAPLRSPGFSDTKRGLGGRAGFNAFLGACMVWLAE